MARCLMIATALVLGVAPARGQSFNLDAGLAGGVPAATYGGAAESPGAWQSLDFASSTTLALVDFDGQPTSVTITASAAFPSASGSDDGPSGDDASLLDDYLDLGSDEAIFTLAGLAAGRYRIWTYAWTPGDPSGVSYVAVSEDTWGVGGAWGGGFADFTTHAIHDVELDADEDVTVHITGVIGDGVLNGMQIVKLPDDPPPVGDPQGFNLDAGSELGTPSRGFGGAGEQPGVWMPIAFSIENPLTLRGLDGEPTTITLEANLPFGPAFSEHDGPSGDEEKLLEDYLDLHTTGGTFTFKGVPAGDYVVYTYAWAPDDDRYRTFVTIGEDSQTIGGAWTGGLEQGVTHARQAVTVPASGRLVIQTFGTKGTLNGIQIVPVVDMPVEPDPEEVPEVVEASEPGVEVVDEPAVTETTTVEEAVEPGPEPTVEVVEPGTDTSSQDASAEAAAEVTAQGGADGCGGGHASELGLLALALVVAWRARRVAA